VKELCRPARFVGFHLAPMRSIRSERLVHSLPSPTRLYSKRESKKIPKETTKMTRKQIIRAWKDAEYRNNLSETERAALPDNPAGVIELSDASLSDATGALAKRDDTTLWTCTMCLPCFGSTYGFAR